MSNLTTRKGIVAHMGESTSRGDWTKRCGEVKAANNGDYPDFWYATVILSGLVGKTLGPGSTSIKVTTL